MLTTSQQARQERMLEVASRLAADGGFDAVQMRRVALESDVALGTLYRYFPSKEHLLVSAMLRQITDLGERLTVRPPVGSHPVDRVVDVLSRSNRALQRQPQFTLAMVRALVAGDQTIGPAVHEITSSMRSIILGAMAVGEKPDNGSERLPLVADTLADVWLSALVAWLSGSIPATGVNEKLERAATLLMEDQSD